MFFEDMILYGTVMKKVALLSLATIFIAGCSATGSESPMASLTNTLTPDSSISKFDVILSGGNVAEAQQLSFDEADYDEDDNSLDDQFWGMQTASLYRFNKDFEESNRYFDLIEDVMYQEDTEGTLTSVSETITSSLTNDTFLDYEQSVYDSIMVNTYKALNFTAMGDLENARVEWNRSDDRQRRAAEFFAERINEKREQQEKEAEEELQENEGAGDVKIDKSMSKANELLADQNIDMSDWTAYDERARKEEFRIDLPVFIASENVNYAGIALPKIEERQDYFNHISINGKSSEVVADMDKIIKAEFKEEWPLILTREITRSVIKTVVQKQINDKNMWLGIAAGVLQGVTTQADTRTWRVLPKNFQALMLENDGSGQLVINSPGLSQSLKVDVDPSKKNIVYIKAINQSLTPSVDVISI